jgi:hypothetical protein
MQFIDSIVLLMSLVAFASAFTVVFIGNHISKSARNLPLIYPSQADFSEASQRREYTLVYLTRLWRAFALIEVLLFSLGGYFLLGAPGAIIIGVLVISDYVRNNSPISSIYKDPLIRIERNLEQTLQRTNNVDALLANQFERISKNREMSDSDYSKLLTYFSRRTDKIGEIAKDIALRKTE